MANIPSNEQVIKFDKYTEELLEKIKNENIPIHPTVWSLLTHVLGNRAYAISLNLEDLLATPKWILKAGSYLMIFFYKISGNRGKMYTLEEYLHRALNNIYMIKDFLERLRKATGRGPGY